MSPCLAIEGKLRRTVCYDKQRAGRDINYCQLTPHTQLGGFLCVPIVGVNQNLLRKITAGPQVYSFGRSNDHFFFKNVEYIQRLGGGQYYWT
jgi:hypothetical protein